MNKKLKTILAAGFLVAAIAAQACTLAAWDNNTGAAAGGPGDANVLARYSGLCSMDGTNGTVLNNGTGPLGNGVGAAVSGPAGEATMISRFYFLASGSGTATIFEAYSDELGATPVYTVTYDGTNVTVTPAGGTAAMAAVSTTTQWHSVEVKWASGNGTTGGAIDVWVDTDAAATPTPAPADASTTSAVAATSIQAIKLGGIANTFSTLLFDDYESRRSTAIGRLVVGDANATGVVSIADAVSIVNELGSVFNTGTPDCTENGVVSIADAVCVVNLL